MRTIFTVSAADSKEKVRTAKKIHQMESFTKICIIAEDSETPITPGDRVVTFKCKSFAIDPEHSSTNHGDIFKTEIDGENVVIRIPENYFLGRIIAGHV